MITINGDNQIIINLEQNGNIVSLSVSEQTDEFSNMLSMMNGVFDEQTGLKMKILNKPFYNVSKKTLYLRGRDKTHDLDVVSINLNDVGLSFAQLQEAIVRMLCKIEEPEVVPANHNDGGVPTPGGTSHVRFAFITKSMAEKLKLTGKHNYPLNRRWDVGTKPIKTINAHYNEHIGQIVDVLNKAYDLKDKDANVVNPHRVSKQQAKSAVESLRKLFDDAERGDYLVALWRCVSGLRGPDFVDRP